MAASVARRVMPAPARAALWEASLSASARAHPDASRGAADAALLVRTKDPAVAVDRRRAATALAATREAIVAMAAGPAAAAGDAGAAAAALGIPALRPFLPSTSPAGSGVADTAATAAAAVDGPAVGTTTAQVVSAMAGLRPWTLRNAERAFHVALEGEFADDYGGPYRAVLASVESETQPPEAEDAAKATKAAIVAMQRRLQAGAPPAAQEAIRKAIMAAGAVPLFRLTPNARSASALGGDDGLADDVVPLPGRTLLETARDPGLAAGLAASYEAVGVLMGIAIRTGAPLGLRLADVVWDRLLDALSARTGWASPSGGGQAARLVGRVERAALEYRADATLPGEEAEAAAAAAGTWDGAVAAMARGMLTQVPGPTLRLFSRRELAEGVAGVAELDVGALRRCTLYEGVASRLGEGTATREAADTARGPIAAFWSVLEGFSPRERGLYLKFVWGRSRLPSASATLGTAGETPSGLASASSAAGGGVEQAAAELRLQHFLNVVRMPDAVTRQANAILRDAASRIRGRGGRRRGAVDAAEVEAALTPQERRRLDVLVKRMPLPSASTCFGRMTLPMYPSTAIMADRIRYALANCDDIDADADAAAVAAHAARQRRT